MPTITGTLKDSLANVANCVLLTGLSGAGYDIANDAIILPESAKSIAAGVVSITPVASVLMVPDNLTYSFRVQDGAGVQRAAATGVTVTPAMDTLDDIL